MNFNIDTQEIFDSVLEDAKKDFRDRLNSKTSQLLSETFRPKNSHFGTGIGTEMVQKALEDYVLSDEFASKVQEAAKRHADSAIDNAVKKAMDHLARKAVFKDILTD